MTIRTTTDPMTLNDVTRFEEHLSLFEGDAENGLEIRFESEDTRRDYINLHPHGPKILKGSDAEDYVAEGFTWAVVP
jgi:hypothetical protein